MTADPSSRIYLDNAATSWPKPEGVYAAVDDYQRNSGAPAGRSGYGHAMEVGRRLERLRRDLLQLVRAPEDQFTAVFTLNGTDSLNIALHGVLRPGDHAITSDAEHNSVLRPLRLLEEQREVRVTRVPVDANGWADPDAIRRAIQPSTRLIALVHASNVTGIVQAIDQVGVIAREHQVLFLVDAAQSLGRWLFDLEQLPVDLLAAPGHKGLLGPLGTGVLIARRSVAQKMIPLRQGGTGSQSESDRQPDSLPDRLEAGNLNVPGLLGMAAGVEWLMEQGVKSVAYHEQKLTEWLEDRLALSGVQLYGHQGGHPRVAVTSLNIPGFEPQELASVLDATAAVQVRAGLHCAPRMHRALRTDRLGGTVRISLGPYNTLEQLQRTAELLETLAAGT